MTEIHAAQSMFGVRNLPSRRPKLLLVDDEPINIAVLTGAFSSDYDIVTANDGAQAIASCRGQLPDLVLLDIVMPGADGYEVCAQLKADADTRDVPVIFVTSRSDAESETKGLAVGAVDFIFKPFNPDVVRARVMTHLTLKFQSDLLRQMVFIDGLTGVFNRRHFDERLAIEYRRAERSGIPLGLLLIDIDFFKHYNDHYGHQAGDDCLKRVAASVKARLQRPGDLLARYGGEEFACILSDTDFTGAMIVANGLEQYVRSLQIAHAASDVDKVVTVSLGVASKAPGGQGSPASLLALADAELYRAKSGGRGRACGTPQNGASQPVSR